MLTTRDGDLVTTGQAMEDIDDLAAYARTEDAMRNIYGSLESFEYVRSDGYLYTVQVADRLAHPTFLHVTFFNGDRSVNMTVARSAVDSEAAPEITVHDTTDT